MDKIKIDGVEISKDEMLERIKNLSVEEKILVALRYQKGKSIGEIAKIYKTDVKKIVERFENITKRLTWKE